MFGIFTRKATEVIVKAKNIDNRDQMQAICAAGLLVAAAEGGISDEEINTITTIIQNKPELASFGGEIGATIGRYRQLLMAGAVNGRVSTSGKMSMFKELNDIKQRSKPEEASNVFAVAVDVAFADGECSKQELEMLGQIASKLGVTNLAEFGLPKAA